MPYGLFGLFYVIMAASMIAAYFVDPGTIKKMSEETSTVDDSQKRSTEFFLMTLLCIYLTICVNTEHTYGSEYIFSIRDI